MPRPGNLRTIAATAFGVAALAAVGGGAAAVAVATTPVPTPLPTTAIGKATPVPTLTPTPLPLPSSTLFCGGATPGGNYQISTSADGSEVYLSWSIAGSLNGFPDFCYYTPAQYDVLIDDVKVAHVWGSYGADYTARGLEVGSTHTFKVVPTNNANIQTLSREYTITPAPPTPAPTATPIPTPTPEVTPTPIPTPVPTATPVPTPRPLPTPPGPNLCIDPPLPPLPPLHQVTAVTQDSVTFKWRVPYGCYSAPLKAKVLVDGNPVPTTSTGFSGTETLTGLSPATTYSVAVSVVDPYDRTTAVDTFDVTTAAVETTPTPVPPTPRPLPSQDFTVAGSTTLRAKTAVGSFRLTGTSTLTAAVGSSGGPVQLAPTTGTLLVAGAFGVQAKLTFGPGALSLPVTATPTATFTAPLTITKATLFGIPLTQGGTCRTIKPIKATLVPAGTFGITAGGTLAGAYTPGGFTGCSTLGGFLGATGAKSSLTLKLTPTTPTPAPTPSPVPIP